MTFSIVARDPKTGAFGVATATAGPMVGALVPHTRSGRGAVATQAMTNPYLGFDALELLESHDAEGALQAALAKDTGAALRQVVVVDLTGTTAAWTGQSCIPFAGHLFESGVAVAGNMLAGPRVLADMLSSYRSREGKTDFASNLLDVLKAGAGAGGDIRGIGSAALRVHGAEAFPDVDIRVDWSKDPLADMEALLRRALAGDYAEFFAALPRRNSSSHHGK
jgi:uncharacterized Ntn-hydrolase superfamily protein